MMKGLQFLANAITSELLQASGIAHLSPPHLLSWIHLENNILFPRAIAMESEKEVSV